MWKLLAKESLEGGLERVAFGGQTGGFSGVTDGRRQQLRGGAGAGGVHQLGKLREPVKVDGLKPQRDFALREIALMASGVLLFQRVANQGLNSGGGFGRHKDLQLK